MSFVRPIYVLCRREYVLCIFYQSMVSSLSRGKSLWKDLHICALFRGFLPCIPTEACSKSFLTSKMEHFAKAAIGSYCEFLWYTETLIYKFVQKQMRHNTKLHMMLYLYAYTKTVIKPFKM